MISALVITRSSAPLGARGSRALPHAVANDFAAAEGDLVAIDREILLDFDDQFGIGQPDAIALGRPVQIGVGASWESRGSFVPLAFVAQHQPFAREFHQRDLFLLARLKPHRGARRDVQAHAASRVPGRNRARR